MDRPKQLLLDFSHRPALGRENFLVAPSNQDAVAWLDSWPWSAGTLALCGPPGCGKSHLVHAFATINEAVIVSAKKLETRHPPILLASHRVVVIEDADRGVDPLALFHLYNASKEAGASLLLTGRTPPTRWGFSLADLRSRLATIPVAEILPPDDALMGAVLVKLFADRQLRVTPPVIDFLLRHMERSFSVARAVVAEADGMAATRHRAVAVPLVAEALRKLEGEERKEERGG